MTSDSAPFLRHFDEHAEVVVGAWNALHRLDDRAHVLHLGDELLRALRVRPEIRLGLKPFDLTEPPQVGGVVKDSP
jgi:hypothetical protein